VKLFPHCTSLAFTRHNHVFAIAVLAFILPLNAFSAFSQPVLTLHDSQQVYSLAGHFDYFLDNNQNRTIEDISSDSMRTKFRFVGIESPHFGHVYDVLWLRFKIQDSSISRQEWMIENEYAIVEKVSLFFKDEYGNWRVENTGSLVPFKSRVYPHRKLILPIPSMGKETKEFYLRVFTRTSMSLPLRIFSHSALTNLDQQEYFYFGMFNGILIVMFLYNLFLYLSVRETSYLAYTIYVLCFGTYESLIDGTAVQFISDHLPITRMAIVFAWLTITSSCFFAVIYLKLKMSQVHLNVTMISFSIAGIIMAIYSMVGDFILSNFIVNLVGISLPIIQLIFGFIRFRQGFEPAKYYVIAVLGYVLGFSIRAIKNLGFVPPTEITLISLQIGVVWEFIILSFGLANRINTVKEEELRERERMRNQIASDIHDEIGSNLSSITITSGLVQKTKNLNDVQKEFLKDISVVAQETADAMRDIVWFINPDHDSAHATFIKIKDIAHTLLFNIHYTFDVDEVTFSKITSLETRRNLYFIYKESLNNIVRHAQATHVDIILKQSPSGLMLTIIDNGIGFDIQKESKGNGLHNLEKRAADMRARLTILSNVNEGTTISLLIKIP